MAPAPATPQTSSSDSGRPSPRDRILLATLLVGTAILYLTNITVNGNANSFYAGAAWAGSQNWEALLFGSVDPSNFITVDKPPVSQWIMGLSGQIFGYSSASMLIPEALMGVAAVALVYAAVTRVGGRTAGLIAGAALALTPVAAMMFRFNNPDAAMVLLMTAAAYCTIRATAKASARWLALAGVALGFAFLAKMLEGIMVLPALGAVYLLAAPTTLARRFIDLTIAAAAMLVSAGWYVVLTLLWPASSRPYLAGSTDNNFMNLVLGYNGLARIEGRDHAGAGQGGPSQAQLSEFAHHNPSIARQFGGGMFGSPPGLTRLFTGEFGAEISFLLPTALVAMVVLLVLRGRAPRTDMVRAATILFALWMLVDGIVLSFMNGTTHPYYSLAIAPPIAGLVGLGINECRQSRSRVGQFGLVAMIVAAGVWGFVLLNREPDWQPWVRWTLLIGAVIAAVILAIPRQRARRITLAGVAVGIACTLGAPAAVAINADTVAHTGGGPSVLPTSHTSTTSGQQGHSTRGMGGFGTASDSAALDALLQSSKARWAAAVNRTSTASALEVNAKAPVMGIGGFSNDPTPTLDQFKAYVADGQIGYYVTPEGQGHSGRQASTASAIQQWVSQNYAARTVGDYEAYNLSAAPKPQSANVTPQTEALSSTHRRTEHHA